MYNFAQYVHIAQRNACKIDHISKTKSRLKKTHELENHFQSNAVLY